MMLFILFLFGLCVGSFLNVVIDRIPQNKSIIHGRSHCDFCNHTLSWYDLIPLFSFLIIGGKCRYCKKPLSWQYPLIECVVGLLFVGLFVFDAPINPSQFFFFFLNLCIFSSAVSLVVMDIKYRILSDKILVFFGLLSFIKIVLENPGEIPLKLGIGLMSALPFLGIFLFSKGRAMGFGDVKLAFLLGFVLGFPNILIAYYCAFLTGGITAIILIITGKKKLQGGTIAFGPFLFLGWLIAYLYGDIVWKYVKYFIGF